MAGRTRTSIANMAADWLDSSPIGNITDNFGDAIIFNRNYDEALEAVLTEFTWTSSKARAQLQPIDLGSQALRSDTDLQTAYAWPSDCLGPIDINGRPVEDLNWDNETIAQTDQHGQVVSRRKVLYCDFTGDILLRYKCVIEPRDMTAHLAKAVSIELAMRCCGKLANSSTKLEQLRDLYAEATRGNSKRIGGHQVDTRTNRPKRARTLPSSGARARAGEGL